MTTIVVHDDLAMQRRDAAFREAFRRCGGILPRIPGIPFYRDGITTGHPTGLWRGRRPLRKQPTT